MENLIKELILLVQEYRHKTGYFPPDLIRGSFKIGNIKVKAPVVTAPLAGISDNTFRIFAKAFGSALNFTEMISGCGIHYNNCSTIAMSHITDFERPCGIQLFGSEPEILAEAAAEVQDRADFIDINMGCPVPKVLKTKSGGFLLTDEKRIESITSKVVSRIKKPLTVKIRLGWDGNSINADRVALIAQECGASAITIHGRTVKQGFKGSADYGIIGKIRKELKIPVIASGDIDSPARAQDVLESTGCDAVMIGRAAKGKLWIFSEILAGLNPEKKSALKDIHSARILDLGVSDEVFPDAIHPGACVPVWFKKDFAILYLKFMAKFSGEEKAVREFKKHFLWIFKGVRGISDIKRRIIEVNDFDGFVKKINSIHKVHDI